MFWFGVFVGFAVGALFMLVSIAWVLLAADRYADQVLHPDPPNVV